MNQPLLFVPYPAIKQLLLSRLQAALALYVSNTSTLINPRKHHISLYRGKDDRQFLYVSAIALQLSAAQNTSALEIATVLTTLIRTSSEPNDSISQDFTAQVVPPGLIHLKISQPYLAAWLQHLAQGEQEKIEHFSHLPLCPSPSRLFAVHYAHARCCSLIRMADREGLITLQPPPLPFHLLTPKPIPWLNSDQKLSLCHTSELALISQLLSLLDNLYCPCSHLQNVAWERAALNLSQAFQTFYSSSRIWGEVRIQTPDLAQARVGLVLATRSILQLLLEDFFGLLAPLEL